MKYWIKAKYYQFLILLGLRIDGEWLLLRVLIREYGDDRAQSLYTSAILLDIKYNSVPTKKKIQQIVAVTKPKL